MKKQNEIFLKKASVHDDDLITISAREVKDLFRSVGVSPALAPVEKGKNVELKLVPRGRGDKFAEWLSFTVNRRGKTLACHGAAFGWSQYPNVGAPIKCRVIQISFNIDV
jgi:hypothetical protein